MHKFKKRLKKKFLHIFCKILLLIDEPLLKLHDKLIKQYFKLNKTKKVDKKAEKWAKLNPWFGYDREMTYFAYEVHKDLIKEKIKVSSKKYYDLIDIRVYKKFKHRLLNFYSSNN